MEQRLSTKTKICYAASEAGMIIVANTLATQLMFFMTDFLGITAAAAGTMFLVARIWDAINDPMMGMIAERTNTRWGKYRPWLLFGGIPLAISLFLNLNQVNFGKYNLVYMYVVYIFFGMAYTAAFIPYTTMVSNLARTPEDRASLSSIKSGFQGVGVLFASVLTLPLLQHFGNGEITVDGFRKVGLLFGVIALGLFLLTFFTVKERPMEYTAPQKYTVRMIADLIFRNKNLMLIMVMYFFIYLRIYLNNAAAIYFFRYNRQNLNIMPIYMAVASFTNIIAAAVVPAIAGRIGKRKLTILGAVISALSYVGLYLTRMAATPVFLLMALFTWFCGSIPATLIWAFVADVADESARKNGYRSDSILYSVTSFANKLSGAVSGFVSGAVLTITGYVANQQQTALASFGIDVTMFVLPALCMVFVAISIFFYCGEKAAK